MRINWKWIDRSDESHSHNGIINLEVWEADDSIDSDKPNWLVAFDVANGTEIASDYGNRKPERRLKTREDAKKYAEKLANKWLEKLFRGLKK